VTLVIANLLINGAVNASIYALIALGFSLTFGVAGIVNLYHGAYYMVGAYLAYFFISIGIPAFFSVILSLLSVMLIGVFLMKYPILYLQRKGESIYILILTLGSAYFTQYLFKLVFGTSHYSIKPFYDKSMLLLGETIPGSRIFAFFVSVVSIVIVMFFINKTKFGKLILATSQDKYAAQLLGVNTSLIFIVTSALSAGLSGLAGIVISPFLSINLGMWLPTLIKAFSIVILGGLGSIWGSILAAIFMAYLEQFVALVWTSSMTEVVFLVIVFLFLVFKPTGFMGKKVA